MTWNYRLVKHSYREHDGYEEYVVHAVYYDENDEISFISSNAEQIYGTSLGEVKEHLKMLEKALELPVIDPEEAIGVRFPC